MKTGRRSGGRPLCVSCAIWLDAALCIGQHTMPCASQAMMYRPCRPCTMLFSECIVQPGSLACTRALRTQCQWRPAAVTAEKRHHQPVLGVLLSRVVMLLSVCCTAERNCDCMCVYHNTRGGGGRMLVNLVNVCVCCVFLVDNALPCLLLLILILLFFNQDPTVLVFMPTWSYL